MGGEVVRHLVEVQEDRRRNAAGSRSDEIAVVQQDRCRSMPRVTWIVLPR